MVITTQLQTKITLLLTWRKMMHHWISGIALEQYIWSTVIVPSPSTSKKMWFMVELLHPHIYSIVFLFLDFYTYNTFTGNGNILGRTSISKTEEKTTKRCHFRIIERCKCKQTKFYDSQNNNQKRRKRKINLKLKTTMSHLCKKKKQNSNELK